MKNVNIHKPRAGKGEHLIVVRAPKIAVKNARTGRQIRLGFMAGQITVPADFDRMGDRNVEQLFVA